MLLFWFLLLLGGGSVLAVDQEFTFALPDLEGHISLGVYDSANKLVRTLFVGATEQNFTIGLDGLGTQWDGKDDLGRPLPAGKYFVRGYLVGQVLKSEGIAYHFNDWVDADTSPRLSDPRVIWAARDTICLAGSKVACSFTAAAGLRQFAALPEGAQFRGSDEAHAFFDAGGLYALNYAVPSQSILGGKEAAPFSSAAEWRDQIYLAPAPGANEQRLTVARLTPAPAIVAPAESPLHVTFLDANEAGLLASDGRSVWIFQGDKFARVPFAEDLSISALSAGVGETFWVAGQAKGLSFIRQYAFTGEILRQLDGDYRSLFANKNQEQIFLEESSTDGGLTIKGLQPTADSAASAKVAPHPVNWEVFLEKTTVPCEKFGLVAGHLVANAGDAAQNDKDRVPLVKAGPSDTPEVLDLQVVAQQDEIWLQSADGLKFVLVGKLSEAGRCIIAGDGDAATVFAGNGAVVAEYQLTGLEQIGKIDAGEIDLP